MLIRFVLVALAGVLLAAPVLAGPRVRVALLPIYPIHFTVLYLYRS